MDYLLEIANQQLVTIARTTAYHCDEQHEYMKGAGGTDWFPHKWVVEAMRAAVTIRNTQAEDMVREELHQARAQLAKAQALLRDLDDAWNSHDGREWFGKLMQKVESLLASTEPSAPVEIDERARFEKAVIDKAERFHPNLEQYGEHPEAEYRDPKIEWAWGLWQARSALARKP